MYNISVEEVYNNLVLDDEISNIYKQIEIMETKEDDIAYHNFEHVKNVTSIAEKILLDLKFDMDDTYKVKIACLLHDVGALEGKENHTERSYIFAKEYFEKNNWIFDGKEDILDAIKNHSAGFDTDNILILAVILADKLDIKKTRISNAGKNVIGNRQYQHIEDIEIDINDNLITINFITDGKMDIVEVNNYYFTSKVFKAIAAFSNKLNINYKIMLDNKEWVI